MIVRPFSYVWGNGWWLTALLLAVLVSPAVSSAGTPPSLMPVVDAKWRYYKSSHFELYSRESDRASRELLHNLELLRAVFLDRTQLVQRLQVDVTVYYFNTRREFEAYAPEEMTKNSNFAGFHLFRPDRAVISMAPADDADAAQQTIFHEYVHHLFRVAERDPPLWFNEGTADVLAGIRVVGDRVQIGTPLEDRALYLREETLLPLDQLFAATHESRIYSEEKHTGAFYSESWALLHFWHFGDAGFARDAVDRFLRVAGDREAAAKADLPKLFQACFGCDYAEMLRRLKKYIRTGSYRAGSYPMPKIDAASSYVTRPVPVDEITVRLAELALRVKHSAIGKFVLLDAATARPTDPRPFEVLGTEAFMENDFRMATERWEQALEAGSKNAAVVRELALMEGHVWFEKFDENFQLSSEIATRMRARLLRSIEMEPAQGAAYEMLSWVEAFTEVPDAKNINLVIAHLSTMAEKKRTLIGLSMVMLRVRKYDVAAMLLGHLNELHLDPVEAHAAEVLGARLAAEDPTHAAEATTSVPEQKLVAPPPSTPGLKAPSVALPDDL